MSVSDTLQSNDDNYGVDIPLGDPVPAAATTSAPAGRWSASGSAPALGGSSTRVTATLAGAEEPWPTRRSGVLDLPIPGWLLRGSPSTKEGRRHYDGLKRALDVVGAASLLVLSSPLWLLCAATIKLDSPGPVIFAQYRYGRDGRRFLMYKFRTMVVDAEARRAELAQLNERQWPDFKIQRDPRITRVGAILRRLSIDELPQLWNVFKGDMSLVGPRPTSFPTEQFDAWRRRRFDVPPGLTGIWQVYGRNETRFDERCRLDIHYVENRSFWLDLYLLAMTLPVLLFRPSGS